MTLFRYIIMATNLLCTALFFAAIERNSVITQFSMIKRGDKLKPFIIFKLFQFYQKPTVFEPSHQKPTVSEPSHQKPTVSEPSHQKPTVSEPSLLQNE